VVTIITGRKRRSIDNRRKEEGYRKNGRKGDHGEKEAGGQRSRWKRQDKGDGTEWLEARRPGRLSTQPETNSAVRKNVGGEGRTQKTGDGRTLFELEFED